MHGIVAIVIDIMFPVFAFAYSHCISFSYIIKKRFHQGFAFISIKSA